MRAPGVYIILFGLILSKIPTDLPSHSGSHSPCLGMTTLRFWNCPSFLTFLTSLLSNSKPDFTPLTPSRTPSFWPALNEGVVRAVWPIVMGFFWLWCSQFLTPTILPRWVVLPTKVLLRRTGSPPCWSARRIRRNSSPQPPPSSSIAGLNMHSQSHSKDAHQYSG